MEPKVSIIIPVYGVEKYLHKCLSSIVNQTYQNIEILVVNDGSPDRCQEIIDEFEKKYPDKVIGLEKENGGLSDARNYGLSYATGEYISFIDSDDYVENTMIEKMVNSALQCDSDLVICDLEYVWEDGSKETEFMPGVHFFENEPLEKCLFLSPLFAWNKLYKKDFFINSGLKYPKGLWYEDIPVTVPLFALANKVSYVNEVFIHYLQRKSSIMGSGYDPRMFHIFTELESVYKYFDEKKLLDKFHDELEYLYIEHFLVYGAFRFLRTDHYKELLNEGFALIKKRFPNYKKNKYIKSFSKKNQIFLKTLCPLTFSLYKKYIESRDKKND